MRHFRRKPAPTKTFPVVKWQNLSRGQSSGRTSNLVLLLSVIGRWGSSEPFLMSFTSLHQCLSRNTACLSMVKSTGREGKRGETPRRNKTTTSISATTSVKGHEIAKTTAKPWRKLFVGHDHFEETYRASAATGSTLSGLDSGGLLPWAPASRPVGEGNDLFRYPFQ